MKEQTKERWVQVKTSSGMFSSEYAVLLETADGEVSFFIDKDLVRESPTGSLVKVTLVESNPSKHRMRVLLPTETFETSSRWVDINT